MKSLRLISSLNLILLGLILFVIIACETKQESIKTRSIKAAVPNKYIPKRELKKPVTIPVVKPDSTITPDTVETHDTRPQKKTEIKMFRRVLNFHKKPLIT
jgi:hypothetical protein